MREVYEEKGLFGVHSDNGGGILYEAQFPSRECAQAVADMENSERPPADWEETENRLRIQGFTEKDYYLN